MDILLFEDMCRKREDPEQNVYTLILDVAKIKDAI